MHRGSAKRRAGHSRPDQQHILGQVLALLQAGYNKQALQRLTARPEITSGDSFACYLAGLIQVNLGQDAAALPFYDRALALKPDFADAIEARARLLQRAGRLDEAVAAYDALSPSSPPPRCPARPPSCSISTAPGRRSRPITRSLTPIPPMPPPGTIAVRSWPRGASTPPLTSISIKRSNAIPTTARRFTARPRRCTSRPAGGGPRPMRQGPRRFRRLVPTRQYSLFALARGGIAGRVRQGARAEARRSGRALQQGRDAASARAVSRGCGDARRGASAKSALRGGPAGPRHHEFKYARLEAALRYFNAALEADPACATAYTGRGLALQELGRFGEALADFERSLALNPGLVEGRSNLGALQLLLGDFERGWEGFEYRKLWGNLCKADAATVWPAWNGGACRRQKAARAGRGGPRRHLPAGPLFPCARRAGRGGYVPVPPADDRADQERAGRADRRRRETLASASIARCIFSARRARSRRGSIRSPRSVPYIEADPALAARWAASASEATASRLGIAWQGKSRPQGRYGARRPAGRFRAACRNSGRPAHQPAEGPRHRPACR